MFPVVELYSSILKLAPLMLVKLVAGGVLGPVRAEHGGHPRLAVAVVMAMLVSILAGGFVAMLVMGDVIDPTSATRWIVVAAGCVSLLLLAAHMLLEVADLYGARTQGNGPEA